LKFRTTVCLAILLLLSSMLCGAQELTVAAAADLNFALRDIAARYESATGTKVKLTFGSSGNLSTQIENGAPYDLFFSADVDYARKLETSGAAVPGTLYEYAVGKLVLWVPNGSKLDVNRGLAALDSPMVKKIAIANPAHAPYGRAAVAALKNQGIYDRVQDKLVLGENISQTAQFVESGNADAGLLALSLALAPTMKNEGRYSQIPQSSYPEIRQAVVVLKSAKDKAAASRFLDFVKSPPAAESLRQYGFERR
jgi:molybdate transport system substrate-binding protein